MQGWSLIVNAISSRDGVVTMAVGVRGVWPALRRDHRCHMSPERSRSRSTIGQWSRQSAPVPAQWRTHSQSQVTLHHAGHTAAGHGGHGRPRHPRPRAGAAPQPGHRPGGGDRRAEGDHLQVSRWAAPCILHPTLRHTEVTNNICIVIMEHLNHCKVMKESQ